MKAIFIFYFFMILGRKILIIFPPLNIIENFDTKLI